jgi:hypothetical protein
MANRVFHRQISANNVTLRANVSRFTSSTTKKLRGQHLVFCNGGVPNLPSGRQIARPDQPAHRFGLRVLPSRVVFVLFVRTAPHPKPATPEFDTEETIRRRFLSDTRLQETGDSQRNDERKDADTNKSGS